ncbi:HAD-IC family P-type ATPase [Caldimonas brevitalea]|uniref:Cu+-exporting ATPase n=1 Tax=Caldimonas brevitalea TaxID=413882 RepID=A0A0G3BS74_9BURK|nr:HAD-IC family P-type ATPase [Caldimonas brevitalea]AKJ29385.1 Cu+-exporting ATPase [Caldimonas brevitalea]
MQASHPPPPGRQGDTAHRPDATTQAPAQGDDEAVALRDLRWRFWCTLPLTAAMTALEMAPRPLGWISPGRQDWLELLLSLPVVLWAGAPMFIGCAQSIARRTPDRWTLFGIGTGATFVYSVAVTLAPRLFPVTAAADGWTGVHLEAAAVIISLMLGLQMLELRARAVAQPVVSQALPPPIVQRVAQAQRSQASMQAWADELAGHAVPALLTIAVLTWLAWGVLGSEQGWQLGLVHAVAVTLIACPAALVLATPLSGMVAIGRAAALGIVFRDATALEQFSRIDTLMVDKTGLVTQGQPTVASVVAAPGVCEDEVLRLAASLEQQGRHPLALAIVAAARARGLVPEQVQDMTAAPGRGMRGSVAGQRLALGNRLLMAHVGVDLSLLQTPAEGLREAGCSVVFLAYEPPLGRPEGLAPDRTQPHPLLGLLALSDPIHATSAEAVQALHATGLRLVMTTSDALTTGVALAQQLGIDEVYGEVEPGDKLTLVHRLQREGRVVGMAAEGRRDAAALDEADAVVALGLGNNAAIDRAHVTLVEPDLLRIARAHAVARAAVVNMWQNLACAFVCPVLGVPLAAGLWYAWTGWPFTPVMAALAGGLSSLAVLANAMRLRSVA